MEFARQTNTLVIAEGVETLREARALYSLGVTLMQGYYFARPAFERLPDVPDELYGTVQRRGRRTYPESFLSEATGASLRQIMRQAVISTNPSYRS